MRDNRFRAGTLIQQGILWIFMMIAASVLGKAPAPSPEWDEALEPIRTMPVQDTGFVFSGVTFAQNHLLAILDDRTYQGRSALSTVVWLMSDPEAKMQAPVLRVTHPDLAKFFGDTRISLSVYRDPSRIEGLRDLIRRDQALMDPLGDLNQRASFLENLEDDFAIVPHEGEWHAPGQVEAGSGIEGEIGAAWEALKESVRGNDVKGGREAAERLAGAVRQATEAQNLDLPWLELDAVYQSHHPFAKSAFFYLLAALCYGAVLLFGWRRLAWVGYGFLALGLTEEVLGIIARWILAGQAPLSNMYESFTFATAGVVLVALIFEATHRIRLAGLGGALLGFIFMIVAHNLPIFDTRIRPLVPALQSSWLTYHVVTIMLSYSAFALSFFVGMCYLIKDSLGGDRSRLRGIRHLPSLNALDVFNYKIIAVGFPLLTAGIILGAVWANTAWGRPWGFDPKETWSAITWLVYAIYLHVRFFAGWKGRRAAVVALIGFGCVLFTYFGVNYLLPSLHSYVG